MISTIGIVSLSSGIIGEDFVKHEVDLGIQRLKGLGLNPIFLSHSQKGLDFIKDHPEARAEDLIQAFSDDSIDMILCAIGGDDTYRLLPYLFENDQLQKVIKPKIFLGFSDTTMNHLMRLEKSQKSALATFGMRNGLILVPRLWEHLVSAIQIQVLTCYKELHSSRGKSSAVASNPSTIFLTTLYTQIAQTSAKNTNFSLTYPTGKERFYC